jgi:hypothetical protein
MKTVSASENNVYVGNASFKANIPEKKKTVSHHNPLSIILHFSTLWSPLLLTDEAPSKKDAVVSPYVTICSKA